MNHLELKLKSEKEHSLFLENLLKALHGEEWGTLTIFRAKELTTISSCELRKLTINRGKPLKDFSDITPAHIRMVHDIIEIVGADHSPRAKDILLKLKAKVDIRTVVVVPREDE